MNITPTPCSETVVRERTRAWLCDTFLYMQADATLRETEPLLAGGVIDSVGVIELVEFLHDAFGIDIADDEITESNLGSLQAIGHFVYGKCTTASAIPARSLHVA